MLKYWYKGCMFCHQGRLFIEHDRTDDQLVLHCEECEYAWKDPEALGSINPDSTLLTLVSDHVLEYPSDSLIRDRGWARYSLHSTEE